MFKYLSYLVILSFMSSITHIQPAVATPSTTKAQEATSSVKVKVSSDQAQQQNIDRWLKAHQDPQVFTWVSPKGLKANLKLSIEQEGALVSITEESFGLSFESQAKDDYSYTKRIYTLTAPYSLLKATYYQQASGQAQIKLWHNHHLSTNDDVKPYQNNDPIKLQNYAQQKIEQFESSNSKSLKNGMSQQKLITKDNLLTHLGLRYSESLASKIVYLLDLSMPKVQDREYHIKYIDERLVNLAHSNHKQGNASHLNWAKLFEYKVVDDQGHMSRSFVNDQGVVLATSLSQQQHLIDLNHLQKPPTSLSYLLYAKERMPKADIRALLNPYKLALKKCLAHPTSPKKTSLGRSNIPNLRLNFVTLKDASSKAAVSKLSAIGFSPQLFWGQRETCLAKVIQTHSQHIEQNIQSSKDLLIEFSLTEL